MLALKDYLFKSPVPSVNHRNIRSEAGSHDASEICWLLSVLLDNVDGLSIK
jgi:hypothetical protein